MSLDTLWRLAVAALWAAAGACLYLILLNRVLLLLRDNPYKRLLVWGSPLVIGLLAAGLGGAVGPALPSLLPLAVLLVVAAGEARRIFIRLNCRGTPPAERVNAVHSLLRPDTTTALALSRYELVAPQWAGERLRIVHLSDLHVDPRLPIDYYRATFARAIAANPDLLVLTGDFVTCAEHVPLLASLLPALQARYGILGVLGNHDYWAGAAEIARVLRQHGIMLLGNGHRRLQAGNGKVLFVGCESPWGGNHWRLPPAGADELVICLTHTPDNVYRMSHPDVTAIFAGHYHAGQVRLPALGPVVIPSAYGRRFDHGHFVVNGTHLFVTAGVGSASPPYRIYCQPDIFVVDILGNHA